MERGARFVLMFDAMSSYRPNLIVRWSLHGPLNQSSTTDRRAAQYRYEVLRTLEEVQSTVAGAEDAVLMNGPTDKGKVLDRKDARVLRRNAEVLREAEAEAGGPLLGAWHAWAAAACA